MVCVARSHYLFCGVVCGQIKLHVESFLQSNSDVCPGVREVSVRCAHVRGDESVSGGISFGGGVNVRGLIAH